MTSLKHDLLHHPFQRRIKYELHKADAVFQGFSDDTIIATRKSACSEPVIVSAIIIAYKLTQKEFGLKENAVIVVREKDGVYRPITAILRNGKGEKQRAQRIIKRIKQIGDEYAKLRGAKVTYKEV